MIKSDMNCRKATRRTGFWHRYLFSAGKWFAIKLDSMISYWNKFVTMSKIDYADIDLGACFVSTSLFDSRTESMSIRYVRGFIRKRIDPEFNIWEIERLKLLCQNHEQNQGDP